MSRVIETEPCGLLFDFDQPRADQVDIRDIARALSQSCRFGGLCRGFFSVAEHALLVHRLVQEAGHPDDICYAALHHDSHETYLGDVVTPLKKKLGREWVELQRSVDLAICDALGVNFHLLDDPAVKSADASALLIEAGALKTSQGVGPQWMNTYRLYGPPGAIKRYWPQEAEALFLAAHQKARGACA